jgi:hypothetical protein
MAGVFVRFAAANQNIRVLQKFKKVSTGLELISDFTLNLSNMISKFLYVKLKYLK